MSTQSDRMGRILLRVRDQLTPDEQRAIVTFNARRQADVRTVPTAYQLQCGIWRVGGR